MGPKVEPTWALPDLMEGAVVLNRMHFCPISSQHGSTPPLESMGAGPPQGAAWSSRVRVLPEALSCCQMVAMS